MPISGCHDLPLATFNLPSRNNPQNKPNSAATMSLMFFPPGILSQAQLNLPLTLLALVGELGLFFSPFRPPYKKNRANGKIVA